MRGVRSSNGYRQGMIKWHKTLSLESLMKLLVTAGGKLTVCFLLLAGFLTIRFADEAWAIRDVVIAQHGTLGNGSLAKQQEMSTVSWKLAILF